MRLYLVRHGEAVSEEVNPERPLSQRGRLDVEKMGRFLRRAKLKVDLIWHSGKVRALETAQILGGALFVKDPPVTRQGLAPLDPIKLIENQLRKREEDLMIVGHLPFLGKLASSLVSGSSSPDLVTFQAGGVACLERLEGGSWRLEWILSPGLL